MNPYNVIALLVALVAMLLQPGDSMNYQAAFSDSRVVFFKVPPNMGINECWFEGSGGNKPLEFEAQWRIEAIEEDGLTGFRQELVGYEAFLQPIPYDSRVNCVMSIMVESSDPPLEEEKLVLSCTQFTRANGIIQVTFRLGRPSQGQECEIWV